MSTHIFRSSYYLFLIKKSICIEINVTLLLLLLLKKVGSARLRESDVYPISPKTPDPQYQP